MLRRIDEMLNCPTVPLNAPTEAEWAEFEAAYCKFPHDFKVFLSQFGTGCIDEFLWFLSPVSPNENLNLTVQLERQLQALRESCDLGLPLFPEEGGILPFGITDNGDLLAWRTHGIPDEWGVVVVDSRAPEYVEFRQSFSRLVAGLLSGETKCTLFPADFPSDRPKFRPAG